jgi:hypothetical protein
MRIAILAAVLLVGFGLGWIVRERTLPKTDPRSTRVAVEPPAPPPVRAADDAEGGAGAAGPRPPRADAGEETALASPVPDAEPAAAKGAEDDQLARWVRSQSAQWKAWAGMQAGQQIDALLRELGFDFETAALIKKAIQAEAERQTDLFMNAMLGEGEIDPDAIGYMMGLPGKLSLELERELATFLGDSQMGVLREGLRHAHEKKMDEFADMQIKMTGIEGLDDVQRAQLRDEFVGRNVMQEQMTQFAEVTRDRTKLQALMSGKVDLRAEMEKSLAPRRERVRRFLTPQQFERYQAYEETLITQAEMGVRMMGAMLAQSEKQAPAGN